MLEALLLCLELISTIVGLVILKTEIDKAVSNLLNYVLALSLESFPVNSYIN